MILRQEVGSFLILQSTKYLCLDYEEDIWDVAMKSKITDRRTWETLGDSFPETERPFAFECGQSVGSMILDLQRFTLATYLNVNYKTSMVKRAVPHAKFVREIKFLLGEQSRRYHIQLSQ